MFMFCDRCAPDTRGGARGGLEGAIAPRRKVKNYFVGDIWHLQYPESHILAPSSEESAPRRKIPGATPSESEALKNE